MAEEKKPYSDKVLKQQKKINDEGQLLVNILKSQLAAQKKISQELGKQNKDRDEAKADEAFILKASREGIKLAKKLADFSRTDLQNKAKRKSFDIAQQNALNEIKILEAKAAEAAEAGLHKREELLLNQVDSTKQAVEASKELTKEYKSLDFAKGFLGGMENLVKDIPVINKLFGGLTKSVNAAGDEYEKSGNERQARLKGYMTFGKELAKLSLGALLAALVAGFVALDKSTVQLTRNLGLGSRSAKKLVGELQGVENQKADLGDLTESAQGLAEALGSAVPPTAKAVFQATILSKRLGISAEASARLYKLSVQNGNSFEATTDTIIGQTKALNATSKVSINYRQILDDISKVSSATLLNTNRFPGGINKAAFAARKLGLSFETLDSSASSMLNFETSIASELEAELLMGKQLNLQKAREAALMGDQATLAQEISKQVGSASQFAKMNVIQQQAVAEAVGMSREDLAESLVQREALLKLERDSGIAGIAKMETEEKIAALIAKGRTEVEALQELGMDEMATQAAAKTAAESMKSAMKSLGANLAKLVTTMTGEQNPLGLVTKAIQNLTKAMEMAFNGIIGDQLRDPSSFLDEEGIQNILANTSQAQLDGVMVSREEFEDALRTANKQQSVLREMNVFGGSNKDIKAAREFVRQTLQSPDNIKGEMRVNDFTLKTHPKDSLAMAGGTQFGKETNDLLRELVKEVKASGNTYLDSRKISEVMRLNAYEQ